MKSFKEFMLAEATDKKQQSVIKRLEYLSNSLNKYGHRWGENPSTRMQSWVDEYEDIKQDNKQAWQEYCKKNGFTLDHDAYDCLA